MSPTGAQITAGFIGVAIFNAVTVAYVWLKRLHARDKTLARLLWADIGSLVAVIIFFALSLSLYESLATTYTYQGYRDYSVPVTRTAYGVQDATPLLATFLALFGATAGVVVTATVLTCVSVSKQRARDLADDVCPGQVPEVKELVLGKLKSLTTHKLLKELAATGNRERVATVLQCLTEWTLRELEKLAEEKGN
jgi:hypothetical protein